MHINFYKISKSEAYLGLLQTSQIKTFPTTVNGYPVDKGRKLNVHKRFRRRPGRSMYVQFTSCVYGVIPAFYCCKASLDVCRSPAHFCKQVNHLPLLFLESVMGCSKSEELRGSATFSKVQEKTEKEMKFSSNSGSLLQLKKIHLQI